MLLNLKKVQRLFVGKDQGSLWSYDGKPVQFSDGNSILLSMGQGNYIFIGSTIFSFYSKEPVQLFFSTVGNNDVPYPGCLTWNHYLSMGEQRKIPLADFPEDTEWGDADYYMYHKMSKTKSYDQYPLLDQYQLLVQRL